MNLTFENSIEAKKKKKKKNRLQIKKELVLIFNLKNLFYLL